MESSWHVAFVLGALLLSGAGLALLRQSLYEVDLSSPEGDPLLQGLFATFYAIIAYLAFRTPNAVSNVVRCSRPLIALSLLCVISIFWSEDPALTARRSVALLATTTTGTLLGVAIGPRDYIQLLYRVLAGAMLLSAIFVFMTPWGTPSGIPDWNWNGAMVHKNALGRIAAFSAITSAYMAYRTRKTAAAVIMLTSVILLFGSSSRTALLSAAVAGGVGLVAQQIVRRRRYLVAALVTFLVALIAGSSVIVANIGVTLTSRIGRDDTLSGRTVLWSRLVDDLRVRPILGYGYAGYWSNRSGDLAEAVRRDVGWNSPHAHNGFVDVTLQLGIVGLGVFLFGFVEMSKRIISSLWRSRTPEAVWLCTFIALWTCTNLTESAVLIRNDLFWLTYAASLPMVSRLETRLQC